MNTPFSFIGERPGRAYLASAMIGLFMLAACNSEATSSQATSEAGPDSQSQQDAGALMDARLADIDNIVAALSDYHSDHETYPDTDMNWRGIAWGHAPGANWIPGLVPDYIAQLPRDPSLGEAKSDPQYIYISDGSGYKLIAHNVSDVADLPSDTSVAPDPIRPESAFGVWTDGFSEY